jgi:hypothetical protein
MRAFYPQRACGYGGALGLQYAVPQGAFPGQGNIVVVQSRVVSKTSVYRFSSQIGYYKKITTSFSDGTQQVQKRPITVTFSNRNDVYTTSRHGKTFKIGYLKNGTFVALK